MPENQPNSLKRAMKWVVHALLKMSSFRFAVLLIMVAVVVSNMIVLTIDILWDGRFSAELEFAGIVTPFLDSLLLVIFMIAILDEIREEVERRKRVEAQIRSLNEALELKVQERTQQLLAVQEELVHKEKLALLGQVADTVGHELRNPLGVINNAVYFLQTVLFDADVTTKEYLDIIKDETADAERIVSDLLDAVRTKPPHPEILDIAEVIGQTLRKCDIPPSVTVSLDIPVTLSAVRADPMHLHQVLWNLITNGLEAMPQGGTLSVGVEENQTAHILRISVKDSGIGIPQEQQAKLFQPLFTTKARHIGLGLVVVKNLVQVNGGSVAVESYPGMGSTFTVTLLVEVGL